MRVGVGERGRRKNWEVRSLGTRKAKGIELLRWVAALPAALLAGFATTVVVLRFSNWVYGLDQQNWPDAIAIILPGGAMLVAVLIAAWVAPRARLATAISMFLLFGSLYTLMNAVIFHASEAKAIFDAPLTATYVSGAFACLVVWLHQRPRPA
jgi:hypothetical protein